MRESCWLKKRGHAQTSEQEERCGAPEELPLRTHRCAARGDFRENLAHRLGRDRGGIIAANACARPRTDPWTDSWTDRRDRRGAGRFDLDLLQQPSLRSKTERRGRRRGIVAEERIDRHPRLQRGHLGLNRRRGVSERALESCDVDIVQHAEHLERRKLQELVARRRG